MPRVAYQHGCISYISANGRKLLLEADRVVADKIASKATSRDIALNCYQQACRINRALTRSYSIGYLFRAFYETRISYSNFSCLYRKQTTHAYERHTTFTSLPVQSDSHSRYRENQHPVLPTLIVFLWRRSVRNCLITLSSKPRHSNRASHDWNVRTKLSM
jgi:hypothetical protein